MAGGITDSVLEDIKGRIDLADLVASYGVDVRRAGSSLKACCPFHHEKTPSFNINVSKGFYHCFGCGESGDAIKFVEKMEGLSFVDAVKKLASRCGITIEEKADPEAKLRKRLFALMAELALFYRRCLLKTREAQIARDYLEKRALDEKTCEDWLVGYAPQGVATMLKWAEKYGYTAEEMYSAGVIKPPSRPGDRGFHRFGGRLVFPIRDRQGRTVAFTGRQIVERKNSGKYVNSPVTPIFKKSSVLFGFDRAQGPVARAKKREIICCEGQIDTIRLHLCGFDTAVASQGTAFTIEHARLVKRVADSAVLMFDDDGAGHKATIHVGAMLLSMEMPVRVAALPGGEDPDSFLRKNPASALQSIIDAAESIVSFQARIERAKEQNPDSIDASMRIARAVVATIAASKSAILRARLVDEAAKLLKLPSPALEDELQKTKSPEFSVPEDADGLDADSFEALPGAGEQEGGAIPVQYAKPNGEEASFMAFLLANEYDRTVDDTIGTYLPLEVFAHDFTRRFVDTWRAEASKGDDAMAKFSESLAGAESELFGELMLSAGKTQASSRKPSDIAQEFVRRLWKEKLVRERGALSVSDPASVEWNMKLTCDIKRFDKLRWRDVKDLIKDYLMKGERET